MRTKIVFLSLLIFQVMFPRANAQTPPSDVNEFEFCGYDWAEPAPEFVAEFNRVERQRVSLGYTRVCDRVFQYADLHKAIKPWGEILPLLGFIPKGRVDHFFGRMGSDDHWRRHVGGVSRARRSR